MATGRHLKPAPAHLRAPAAPYASQARLLLTALPLLFLVIVVARYAVDMPFWDQWSFVPLLEKLYAGQLALGDLWAQHNEHRPLFAKLIMLGLARLTHWNIIWELALNVFLAVGTFAALAWQIRATRLALSPGAQTLRWAVPAASLAVFSVSQYQNWLWGWQIQMVLNLLAATGSMVLLAQRAFSWAKLGCAAALGIVATYTFANGLLCWPIGLVLVLLVNRGRKERNAAAGAWLVVSALTIASYLWRYHRPEQHPPTTLLFSMPLAYLSYVLKFIGGLGAQFSHGAEPGQHALGSLALLEGALGLFAFGWATWRILRQRLASLDTLLPWFALAAYSLGTALITGVGRVGFGSDEALETRYGTMVVPFWVSLFVFLLLLQSPPARQPSARDRTLALTALLTFILALASSSIAATEGAAELSDLQVFCRGVVLDIAAHPEATADYSPLASQGPYLQNLVENYPFLAKHKLSLFR